MKALIVDNSGTDPVMKMGEHPTPEHGESELFVKIKATALNRADLMQKAGKYPPPEGESPILGLEMAGTVISAGSKVSKFKKGDRVYGLLGGGGYAEYCVIHEDLAMPIPDNLSFEEAAAIPEVFLTAYQAISWLGELKQNETILIHAGASGVGTAAIQISKKLYNAKIAVTAGSDKKLKLCESLGADLLVNYKKADYSERIKSNFGKNKINLILDFVGAPYWFKNIDVLSTDGCIVYLAMLGGTKIDNMSLVPILRKRITIKGSTLRNRPLEYKIRLVSDFQAHVSKYIGSGDIHPVIHSTYDWHQAEEAHQLMGNNQNAGKIILTGM